MNGLSSREGLDRGIPEGLDRQPTLERIRQHLRTPIAERLWHVADGMRLGLSNEDLFALTKIDPWFLEQIRELMQFEALLVGQAGKKPATLEESLLWEAKELGFSDERIAQLIGVTSASRISIRRTEANVRPARRTGRK
jgi:carbamoyl-phosphate synthase large subunit